MQWTLHHSQMMSVLLGLGVTNPCQRRMQKLWGRFSIFHFYNSTRDHHFYFMGRAWPYGSKKEQSVVGLNLFV